MNRAELIAQIRLKKSYLCVGLDTDASKLPRHLVGANAMFEFNKAIIDATSEFAVAYKPNIAFYEALGPKGWELLQRTLEYIPKNCYTIADAKRGDIGNTSEMYAKTFFQTYPFDAVTVAPYMGSDSVKPFLDFEGKWVILLALTSNGGSADFQQIRTEKGDAYFERVIKTSSEWAGPEKLMYVVGATKADYIRQIRQLVPHHFILAPGVGAQGGSLSEISEAGLTPDCGLLVNLSRSILYASGGSDFAEASHQEAKRTQQTMKGFLDALT